MSSRIFQLCIVLSFLIFSLTSTNVSVCAQNKLSISDFANNNNISLYWDVLSKTGMLSKGDTIVIFSIDVPVLLLNFQQQFKIIPPILENSAIYVSKDTYILLEDIFKVRKNDNFVDNSKTTTNTNSIRSNIQQNSNNTIIKDSQTQNFTKSKVRKIIIDPGHGGKDPGGVGNITYKNKNYTVKEKDVVLNVSLLIKEYLQKFFPKLSITLTRDSDDYLSLEQRTLLANKYLNELKNGELILFISVHANASPSSSSNGYEIWYLPPEFYRDDLLQDDIDNVALYSIINSLRNSEITLESFELAKLVLQSLEEGISYDFNNRGLKENEWYVVRNAKMPAVLIELGFVTHHKEGYTLSLKNYQNTLAQYIAKGIKNYVELFDVSDIK